MKITRLSETEFQLEPEAREDIGQAHRAEHEEYIFKFEGENYRVTSIEHRSPDPKDLAYIAQAVKV